MDERLRRLAAVRGRRASRTRPRPCRGPSSSSEPRQGPLGFRVRAGAQALAAAAHGRRHGPHRRRRSRSRRRSSSLVGQVRTNASTNATSGRRLATPAPSGSHPVAAPNAPEVVVVPTSGVVDDVMADHVAAAVRRAETDGAAAVIVQLDTLGGSEAAMLRIDASLHSKVPTIVWVGPSGAKAASAGTFITLSANLAYMAPSTNIGAASPVTASGGDIAAPYGQTEADKVMNDAIATIRSIAQERHPQAVDLGRLDGPGRRVRTPRRRRSTRTRSTASPPASTTSSPRPTGRP